MAFVDLLPHLVWALAAVACVFRVVGKGLELKRLQAIEKGLDNQQTSLGQLRLVDQAIGAELDKLKQRLDRLEVVPARKQVF